MPPEPTQPGAHVDLILQQIGSLPTLSPIAVRVMQAANAGDADLRAISKLIESDPSLTAKVLALCRRADWALSKRVMTVDRAVVLLGLEAVRAAVLSVEIHEAFGPALEKNHPESGRRATDPRADRAFDRKELWRHSIAVAAAAELFAESQPAFLGGFSAQEAFLAGLLHDLGKVALEAILPRSYDRVASIARERGLDIAEVERRVIGLDHHAAGKRLAEHWGLPHALQDVMWLHNQPPHLLPDVPHRALVSIVTLADAAARRLHLGWSGTASPIPDASALCAEHGLDPRRLGDFEPELIERVARRCAHLGLDEVTPTRMLLESLAWANGRLGRVTSMLDERARDAARAEAALDHAARFARADASRGSFAATLAAVLAHAQSVLGAAPIALVTEPREGAGWVLHRPAPCGPTAQVLSPPASIAPLRRLFDPAGAGAPALAWLAAAAGDPRAAATRALPLAGSEGGLTAVLLHASAEPERAVGAPGLAALASVWGSALAAASRHDGARRVGEALADANRRVAEMQAKLVDQRSMQRLGEVAAGAAHEMNNPLTVISGSAQSLLQSAREPDKQAAAAAIVRAASKLTDLITSLHLFADPPAPRREPADLAAILHQAAKSARERLPPPSAASKNKTPPRINVSCAPGLAPARLDPAQVTAALAEIILNALQSQPKHGVDVRAAIDPFDDRLVITVTDDGAGMSSHALAHAFDPFFSELPAGRRTGLGLTRARRYVDLHQGDMVLESQPGKGTIVKVLIPDWRAVPVERPVQDAA